MTKNEATHLAFPPLAEGSKINLKFLESLMTELDDGEGFIGMVKCRDLAEMLMSHAAAEWRDQWLNCEPEDKTECEFQSLKWDKFRRENCK